MTKGLNFENAEVFVGSTGVLAESFSIQNRSTLSPARILRNRRPYNVVPNGPIENIFDIQYIVDTSADPFFKLADDIKDRYTQGDNRNWEQVQISCGGITGFGYLQSYSISVRPDQLVRASIGFISFTPTTGITGINADTTVTYANSGMTGLAHGWTSFVPNEANKDVYQPIFGMNYEWTAQWEPTYVIGQHYPSQVQLTAGEENFTYDTDIYSGNFFSGVQLEQLLQFGTINNTQIDALSTLTGDSSTTAMTFSFDGITFVEGQSVQSSLGDIVRTQVTAKRYFR